MEVESYVPQSFNEYICLKGSRLWCGNVNSKEPHVDFENSCYKS